MATLNDNTLIPLLTAAFVQKITTELVGPPGVGKTTFMHRFAQSLSDRLGKPIGLCTRHPSTEDPADVAGLPVVGEIEWQGETVTSAVRSYPSVFPVAPQEHSKTDRVFFPKGEVPEDWEWGTMPQFGILFLDEFRQSPHDVQKPLARLMDEGTLGRFALSEFGHWTVVAASNSSAHRSGAQRELAFITNRKMVLNIEADHEALANWMEEEKFPSAATAYVRAFPASPFTMKVPTHEDPFITPRSMCRGFRLLQAMGGKKGMDLSPLGTEALSGLVGEAAAVEIMAFLRRVDEMPTYEQIVAAPQTAKVPDRPDVCWAVTQMLSEHINKKTFLQAFAYMERLPKDMQASTLRSVLKRDPALARDAKVGKWMAANKELVMAASGR